MSNALMVRPAEAKHEPIQLVSFNLDREEYGVEVLKVREIIRMPVITSVPNVPYYVDGVVNLRGKVISIVSLRKKFGLPEIEYDGQTRIMVLEVGGELMGFVVDAVSEVIRVSSAEIMPTPEVSLGGAGQESITGVINQPDRILVLLNLDNMFSCDEKAYLSTI